MTKEMEKRFAIVKFSMDLIAGDVRMARSERFWDRFVENVKALRLRKKTEMGIFAWAIAMLEGKGMGRRRSRARSHDQRGRFY